MDEFEQSDLENETNDNTFCQNAIHTFLIRNVGRAPVLKVS